MLHPLWFTGFAEGCATIILIMNAIGHPVYYSLVTWLYVFCSDISLKKRESSMALGFFGSYVSLGICIYIGYWSWGVSTGMYSNPDSGTLLLIPIEIATAAVVLLVGMGIVLIKARKEYGSFV
jgi:hypothetical protein